MMNEEDIYPNPEKIEKRLKTLEEERRSLEFKLKDFQQRLGKVEEEIILLKRLLSFIRNNKLID